MIFLSSIITLLIAHRLWRWKFKRPDRGFLSDEPFPTVSVVAYSVLLGLLLWSQVLHNQLEQRLATVASELAGSPTQVSCETFLESWMPKNIWFEGYVPLGSERLYLRHGICRRLQEVIDAPESNNRFHSTALVVLAHEAMHVGGIANEAQTECAAMQRAARAAILLGVADALARELSRSYWRVQYQQIRQTNDDAYYSSECRPMGRLDEGLPFPPWDMEPVRDQAPE